MKNITFGTASTFVQKMKRKKKLPSQDVNLNLISDTQLLIFSMKKEEPFSACFLQEDAAQTELIANFYIEFLVLQIVKLLIRQKTYSEEHALAHIVKIWRVLGRLQNKRKQSM